MVVPNERDSRANSSSRRDPKASSRSNNGSKKSQTSNRAAEVAAFERLVSSFEISLNAQNLSLRTVGTYSDSVRDLQRYLVEQGMPLDPSVISREHLEGFISFILSNVSPKTGGLYKPSTTLTTRATCQLAGDGGASGSALLSARSLVACPVAERA